MKVNSGIKCADCGKILKFDTDSGFIPCSCSSEKAYSVMRQQNHKSLIERYRK